MEGEVELYTERIRNKELLFFAGYILWVIANAFAVTLVNVILLSNVLKIITLVLWVIAIFSKNWDRDAFVRLTCFALICLTVFVNTRDESFVFLAIALFAVYQIDMYKIAKIDLCLRPICILLTITSYFLGTSPGNDMISTWGVLSIRYSLGYYHPNNLFAQVFAFCVALLLVYHDRLKIKHYIFLVLNIFCFGILTQSRTGILILSLMVLMILMRRTKLFKSKIVKYIMQYSYVLCFGFSLIGMGLFLQGKTFFVALNNLITGRFSFAARAFENNGVTLLGQNITYLSTYDVRGSSESAVIVDNYYVYILITWGVIYTVLILFLLTRQQKILLDNGELVFVIVMCCYAVYSITEKPFSNINNHFVLLSISNAIVFSKKSKIKIEVTSKNCPILTQ